MAVAFDEVKAAAIKALRSSVSRYGDCALAYGEVLQDFGAGKADPSDVVRSGVNQAVKGVSGAIDDGVTFGKAYLQWTYSLLGLSVIKRERGAPPDVVPPAPAGGAGA